MNKIRVALIQMMPHSDAPEANLLQGEDYCRAARDEGADIVLFPEMWSIGYEIPERNSPSIDDWLAKAIVPTDDPLRRYRALANDLDIAIAITYLERWRGRPRNTAALIDRNGNIVVTYAKVHTCMFDREKCLTPGDEFPVCELDTRNGLVRVGVMICYDREFPESARILMLNGAELILVPNACPMESYRTEQLRTRAIENMVGIALANYPAPHCDGHSVAFHPVLYAAGSEVEHDLLICRADDAEGISVAEFDMDSIREYRTREVHGDAYRRPSCYDALVRRDAQPPFIRADSER